MILTSVFSLRYTFIEEQLLTEAEKTVKIRDFKLRLKTLKSTDIASAY